MISYTVAGVGPAVLLVHAGVADARMWGHQVADLQTDHQVITVDLRGYGGTPLEPGAQYSDAADVLEVLDTLGIGAVNGVGSSYGGYVLQQVASREPHRFARLILLCAPTDNVEPDEALRALWAEENTLIEAGDTTGATNLTVTRWVGPDASEEARELLRTMQQRAYDLQLPAGDVDNEEWPVTPETITAPTLLVTGAHDFRFFTDSADYLAARLPTSTRTDLPWAGHLPTLERPEESTTLLRESLTEEA